MQQLSPLVDALASSEVETFSRLAGMVGHGLDRLAGGLALSVCLPDLLFLALAVALVGVSVGAFAARVSGLARSGVPLVVTIRYQNDPATLTSGPSPASGSGLPRLLRGVA